MKAFYGERQANCWICDQEIAYRLEFPDPDAYQTDHYYPASSHPELIFDPANCRPSHARCNNSRGNKLPEELAATSLGTRSRRW